MSQTLVIQIGNSDNKLTQQRWADFVAEVGFMLERLSPHKHFHGCSEGSQPWQNACWVFESDHGGKIEKELSQLARKYDQDSIALTYGKTVFVGVVR